MCLGSGEAQNDEYIEAMKALWQGPHAEFHGDFVDFAPVTCSQGQSMEAFLSSLEGILKER